MTAILQGLLTLLAFLLPFEVRRPVVSFGAFMVFTDLELVTLLAIGVWAVRAVVQRRIPALRGVLAWGVILCGVALLSAATAPAFRPASVKFTLRMATGVCLMAVVADRGMSLKALVAGAAASSALGIWTCLRPDQTAFLTPLFREREFWIGNSVRLSGTFEYPNIAAAFLEMAFVLSLAHLPPEGGRRKAEGERETAFLSLFAFRFSPSLWAVAQGLILTGAVMTLSRAGLVAALFGLCLVVALHVDRYYRMRRMGGMDRMPSTLPILFIPVKPFLPTLAVTTLCLAGALALYPPFSLRLQTGGDRAWYSARYETLDVPPLFAGGASTAQVRVTNTGQIPWSPKGEHPFRLSYHWLEAGTGKAIPAPQARTDLPGEIGPGASVTLTATVYAPAAPGDYLIAWDMVHEKATWFSQKGCPPQTVPCRVSEATGRQPAMAGRLEAPPDPTALEAESVGRMTLWKAGWAMFRRHPALGVGPDNFRRLWGREFGMDWWDERVHSNNLFIEVLVTTGLLGGLAFLALVVSVLRMQVRFLRRCSPEAFPQMAALFGATAVFLVHGLVDCFIAFTPIYLLFWMVVGLSAGMTNYRRR
jgi:hypothetical protein